MQYKAKNPKEYLEMLEDDWRREKLLELRTIIKKVAPEIKETIEYNMLGYGTGGKNIFHLTAQKAYVSLYIGNIDKVENARTMLKEFEMGKGCIRIKKKVQLDETKIAEFIAQTYAFQEMGGDTSC